MGDWARVRVEDPWYKAQGYADVIDARIESVNVKLLLSDSTAQSEEITLGLSDIEMAT